MAKKPYQLVNDVLRETYQDLLDVVDHRSVGDLNSFYQYNGNAAAVVVANRFGKGLWVNDRGNAKELQLQCLESFVENQDRLVPLNSEAALLRLLDENPGLRSVVYRAANNLSVWYADYKGLSKIDDIEFPPGESFESMKGKVGMYQKLRSKWTVTEDAYLPFVGMINRHAGLNKVLRNRIRKALGDNLRPYLLACIRQYKNEHGVKPRNFADISAIAYRPFITIVPGSRFSSVPKDTKKRRPINVEPLGNMLLQKAVGINMKLKLATSAANDLYEGQLHHAEMCRDTDYATIDFSAASDSITVGLFSLLFNRLASSKGLRRLYRDVMRVRSEMVRIASDKKGIAPETYQRFADDSGEAWMHQTILSSMGNGTTFEVLTSVLLSIARVFDPTARVYGDDVILAADQAERFIEVCELIGFTVNHDKSFWKYDFRESCGTFYQEGFGDILSFEFDAIENEETYNVALNKLLLLKRAYINSPFENLRVIANICSRVRRQLLNIHPGLAGRGPVRDRVYVFRDGRLVSVVEGGYIMDEEEALSPPVVPSFLRREFPGYNPIDVVLKQWNLARPTRYFRALYEIPKLASKASRESIGVERYATYLYAGMLVKDVQRTPRDEREYGTEWCCQVGDYVFKLNDLLSVWKQHLKMVPVMRQ